MRYGLQSAPGAGDRLTRIRDSGLDVAGDVFDYIDL